MYLKKRKMYDLAVELLVSMDLFRQAGIEESPVPPIGLCDYFQRRKYCSESITLYFENMTFWFCLSYGPCHAGIDLSDLNGNVLYSKLLNSNEYKVMISKE